MQKYLKYFLMIIINYFVPCAFLYQIYIISMYHFYNTSIILKESAKSEENIKYKKRSSLRFLIL